MFSWRSGWVCSLWPLSVPYGLPVWLPQILWKSKPECLLPGAPRAFVDACILLLTPVNRHHLGESSFFRNLLPGLLGPLSPLM